MGGEEGATASLSLSLSLSLSRPPSIALASLYSLLRDERFFLFIYFLFVKKTNKKTNVGIYKLLKLARSAHYNCVHHHTLHACGTERAHCCCL